MSHLRFPLIAVLAICTSAGAVRAEPTDEGLHLDYRARSGACPDGERFADVVSAKLGFVPWTKSSKRILRIRISSEGSELVGTLELPDGSSKVLRDATCDALSQAMATAIAVALDRDSAPPAMEAATAPAPADAPRPAPRAATAIVHVRSTVPGVKVSAITERAVVQSSAGTAAGVAWKDICMAPCSFAADPGLKEIAISGNGPATTRQFDLVPGDNYVVARPGSSLMYGTGYVLLSLAPTAAIIGGVFLAIDSPSWALPLTIGGIAGTGVGLGLMYKGQSRIDPDPAPEPTGGSITYTAEF